MIEVRQAEDVGAELRATFPAVANLERMVRRICVSGPADTECRVYVGAVQATNLADGTSRGELDVAEYPAGMEWPANRELVLVWDASSGDAFARIEYDGMEF